jgi:hypothetical protein
MLPAARWSATARVRWIAAKEIATAKIRSRSIIA